MLRSIGNRIVIGDPHTLLAEACKKYIEPEFQVVGIVRDGWQIINTVARVEPDIVLLEIDMPPAGGLAIGRALKKHPHAMKLLFVTSNNSPCAAADALRLGASAYVLKQTKLDELRTALRKVVQGETYVAPSIARDVQDILRRRLGHHSDERLSIREQEVLELLARGMSMKEAGHLLNIQSRTIAFHKYKMMEKLHVSSTADLLKYAIMRGMTNSELAAAA